MADNEAKKTQLFCQTLYLFSTEGRSAGYIQQGLVYTSLQRQSTIIKGRKGNRQAC